MDLRDALQHLDDPDPRAVDRIWRRFEQSRTRRRWPLRVGLATGGLGLVAAATSTLLYINLPEAERTLQVESQDEAHVWSAQVALQATGQGQVTGTDRDVQVHWRSGHLRLEVEPNSGTQLEVLTDEARVEVIGTVLTVDRDALGVTVGVEKGRVRVSCRDGWVGEITRETGSHTCLPTTPAGLLGRADALLDQGASSETVRDALDRGLAIAASGTPVMGELLVRRMHQRAPLDVDGALADAELYLATDAADRASEVRRFAGWLALSERGCEAATPWLTELHTRGSAPDTVLLAECVAGEDPARARRLLLGVLPTLDETWRDRATRDLSMLLEASP